LRMKAGSIQTTGKAVEVTGCGTKEAIMIGSPLSFLWTKQKTNKILFSGFWFSHYIKALLLEAIVADLILLPC
jgi:hypothetical protein